MTFPSSENGGALDLQRRLADSVMVLDLLGTLPELMDEDRVVGLIQDLFVMLCAPSQIYYISSGNDSSLYPSGGNASRELREFLSCNNGSHAWTASGNGFIVRFMRAGTTLGAMEVEGVAFPQYKTHYLNLALTVAQVCSLAIQNARTYRQLNAALAAREKAEREVRSLNEDLRSQIHQVEIANRELDSFAHAVSHDLRAPLRAIHGFSEALIEDYGGVLPPGAQEQVTQIVSATGNMSELIQGLLTLSRNSRGEMKQGVVDLSMLAERIRDELSASDPGRRAIWTIDPGASVLGDARMMEVMLSNLIGNAWKYSMKCDEARISFGIAEEMPGAQFQALSSGRRCTQFYVRDNGAGFDMKHAAKLFQPFHRLHRDEEFPGLGLGLATVQRIVHRHGGDVSAVSSPGQGTTVYFTLPSAQEENTLP